MIPDPHEGTEGHHEWQVRRRLVGSCLPASILQAREQPLCPLRIDYAARGQPLS